MNEQLYDESLDEEDFKWAQEHSLTGLATSDAVLSCPLCFRTVTFLSQRHESFIGQYRSLFVDNCRVLWDTQVQPIKGEHDPSEIFHAVHCSNCDTNIGVRDNEKVYHFFHVLPSQSTNNSQSM